MQEASRWLLFLSYHNKCEKTSSSNETTNNDVDVLTSNSCSASSQNDPNTSPVRNIPIETLANSDTGSTFCFAEKYVQNHLDAHSAVHSALPPSQRNQRQIHQESNSQSHNHNGVAVSHLPRSPSRYLGNIITTF